MYLLTLLGSFKVEELYSAWALVVKLMITWRLGSALNTFCAEIFCESNLTPEVSSSVSSISSALLPPHDSSIKSAEIIKKYILRYIY